MERLQQPLLLWLTALAVMSALGIGQANSEAVEDNKLVKTLTNKPLRVIPQSDNSSSLNTKLVIVGGLVTLNETDGLALATYPQLTELHLDGNLVSSIPAGFFSVVPHLKVLSLSRNKISSLDPESFSGLNQLTELNLSNNLLTSLHTSLFRQLNQLQVLNLQGNPWNCSCSLLSSTGEVIAAAIGSLPVLPTCASPENQIGSDVLEATAACYPPTPASAPTSTTGYKKTPVTLHPSWGSSTIQTNKTKDQTPAGGNSWKFTACVAALALLTSMLIVCAIKGPSWYKLLHNYRHRQLCQEEDEDFVSTVFSQTGRYTRPQTFTFEQANGRTAEEEEVEEDGYYEDPYIKREE